MGIALGARPGTHHPRLEQKRSCHPSPALVWRRDGPFRETGGPCRYFGPQGEGLETLAEAVRELALARSQGQEPEPGEAAPNLRQARSLTEVRGELEALEQDILAGVPYDLCAVRLEGAASALAEITGLDTPEEVLNRIFASFCIGK